MTVAEHRQAMDAFYALERMDASEREDTLDDTSGGAFKVPCSAGLTAVLFRRLKIPIDEWDVLYTKLLGRPVARVWRLYEAALERKPEQYTTLIREFGNRVEAL